MQYWPRIGLTGFVISAVLALYIVFSILASDRKDGRKG
jgi:hypothetical protein